MAGGGPPYPPSQRIVAKGEKMRPYMHEGRCKRRSRVYDLSRCQPLPKFPT